MLYFITICVAFKLMQLKMAFLHSQIFETQLLKTCMYMQNLWLLFTCTEKFQIQQV